MTVADTTNHHRRVLWRIDDGLVDYETAVADMELAVQAIRHEAAPEQVWLLEHPPLYTAGTSAKETDILDPNRLPIHRSGRGGQYTYHGPGQRIGYVLLDLKQRGGDVRCFVHDLEQWLINTLNRFNIRGERRPGRVGVWVKTAQGQDAKIAAIGVRIRRWVSYHGVSLNVDPDLSHYDGIVPCGIREHGVTSLAALGYPVSMAEVDGALRYCFEDIFGPVDPI